MAFTGDELDALARAGPPADEPLRGVTVIEVSTRRMRSVGDADLSPRGDLLVSAADKAGHFVVRPSSAAGDTPDFVAVCSGPPLAPFPPEGLCNVDAPLGEGLVVSSQHMLDGSDPPRIGQQISEINTVVSQIIR